MKVFSRWMPPTRQQPITFTQWIVICLIIGGLITVVVSKMIDDPPFALFLLAFVIWCSYGTIWYNRRLRRLATARSGETLCTFARGFNRRSESFDPWVVRATWDALDPHVSFRGGRVPLRPADRLEEDLLMVPEDIDDLLKEVADRSGHTLDGGEANPFYQRVVTVGDVVRFVCYQPQKEKGGNG